MELLSDMIADIRVSTWVAAAALLATSVLMLALARWRPVRSLLARAYVRHSAVPAPTSITEGLMISEGRRLSGAAAGGIIALAAATFFVYLIGADRGQPATLFLVGFFAIGGVIGRAIASSFGALTRGASSVRVANVRHRGVSDYLPVWASMTTRITVASAVVVSAILTVVTARPSVAAIITGVAVVSLIAFEVSSRLVANAAQEQDSEVALAWDDALRSSAIRDLASATWLLGLFGLFFGIGETLRGIAIVSAFNIVGSTALVAVLGLMLLPSTRGYAFGRLHPELIEENAQ